MTKPAWTPLERAADRNGESSTVCIMSGKMAADTNHRLIAVTSAISKQITERLFIVVSGRLGVWAGLVERQPPRLRTLSALYAGAFANSSESGTGRCIERYRESRGAGQSEGVGACNGGATGASFLQGTAAWRHFNASAHPEYSSSAPQNRRNHRARRADSGTVLGPAARSIASGGARLDTYNRLPEHVLIPLLSKLFDATAPDATALDAREEVN